MTGSSKQSTMPLCVQTELWRVKIVSQSSSIGQEPLFMRSERTWWNTAKGWMWAWVRSWLAKAFERAFEAIECCLEQRCDWFSCCDLYCKGVCFEKCTLLCNQVLRIDCGALTYNWVVSESECSNDGCNLITLTLHWTADRHVSFTTTDVRKHCS